MEHAVDEWYRRRDQADDRSQGEDAAEGRGPLHERGTADALRAAVRERPSDFLLQRLEEAGRDGEEDHPQPEERAVLDGGGPVRQLPVSEREEGVGGDPADGDARADRVGAFRERQLASHSDDSLYAFGHEE